MSYNGSGTFQINTSGQPVVAGTVISSTAFNALTADLATGLSTAITKDGQTTATARIPFAQGISSTLTTDSSSVSTGSIITAGGVGIAKALYVGTTVNIAGTTNLAGLTASSAVATDASKNLVSVTNTGTGNNVLATSPTITTPTLSGDTIAGTINGLTVGRGGGAVATNTAVGASALAATATAESSAFGVGSLQVTTVANNTAFGAYAMNKTTTGTENVSFGRRSLFNNTTGNNNTAIGDVALNANTTGGTNTAIGGQALQANTTASNNTAVGFQALYSNTVGTQNVAVGDTAGYSQTTAGYNNVFLGHAAGYNTTGQNNVVIGNSVNTSVAAVNYELVISSNGGVGKGGSTGFINPNSGGVFQGNNGATWSVTSDQRLKKNIVDNNTGLDIINQIQVRNFEYRLPEEVTELPQDQVIAKTGVQLGVIAQELYQILPECVKTESTGVMTVDSDNLTWYLVNAIKELKAEIDSLKGA